MNELKIEYLKFAEISPYEKNPKEHDVQLITESIKERGFRVPIVIDSFDPSRKVIAAGHGRFKALSYLYRFSPENPPEGIKLDEQNNWLIPCVTGIDSDSIEDFEAFLIDDNNLTLMGGDFTALDASRMWNMEAYLEILSRTIDKVKSVDIDDLTLMTNIAKKNWRNR
jgi:hypothetical protein